MKTWIDQCKNCNRQFENKSGHRQRPRVHCSEECKQKWKYKNRVKEGYFKKFNSRPEVKLRKALWARKNYDKILAWQKNNPEKVKLIRARQAAKRQDYPEEFAQIKYLVRARDKNKCTKCGEKDRSKLVVHHKDKNRYNNDMGNLVTLCRACHGLEHRENLILNRYLPLERRDYAITRSH